METGLKGKTVLISGASGGIGSEIVRGFDREGSRQVLTYLADERGKIEIEQLQETLTGDYITFPADLATEQEVEALFKKADETYGRIDILVACAGVWSETKNVADRTLEEWNRTFQLNSTADFLLTRGFFRNLSYVTDFSRVNTRMHNKTFITDNSLVIIGGRNIGDEYYSALAEMAFADMDVMGIGPVVSEVSTSFDIFWNSETKQAI